MNVGLSVRRATSYEDALLCAQLLVDEYTRQGYAQRTPQKIRKTLAEGVTGQSILFFARREFEIVGTISLIHSGVLPMAEVFPEVNDLGKNIVAAEVGRFACRQEAGFRTPLMLMGAVLKEARRLGITHLVCVVNPHHVGFYTSLGFEIFCADQRPHMKVNGAPAIALIGDIQHKNPARNLPSS